MNKDINAIGIVRQMVADGQISQEVAEKYFPELKESEDEKTKRLLHTIANKISQHLRDIFTEEEFQCFDAWSNAWLEKHCEQKQILDVKIPFGAKDSELEEVSYSIPNGYHAEIEDNKVVIKKGGQKPSWSEEDEMQLDAAIHLVSSTGHIETANWLKSLRPQTFWKPCEEQIKALSNINVTGCISYAEQGQELINLYNDLKKLKE